MAGAWNLDDAYWMSIKAVNDDYNLLFRTMSRTKFLTCWSISDMHYNLLEMGENKCEIVMQIEKSHPYQ